MQIVRLCPSLHDAHLSTSVHRPHQENGMIDTAQDRDVDDARAGEPWYHHFASDKIFV
jgi:hypothetical protein